MQISRQPFKFFPSLPLQTLTLEAATSLLKAGGLLLYPTETFWAIGCLANCPEAITAIFSLKQRSRLKPFPLIAANQGQASEWVDLTYAPAKLLQKFWPGPLTALLPAKNYLAPGLINSQDKAAIRVSASYWATALATSCAYPLIATSANFTGMRPARKRAELDPAFLAACAHRDIPAGILKGESAGQDKPSTMIEPIFKDGRWSLKILREGAISRQALADPDWEIL